MLKKAFSIAYYTAPTSQLRVQFYVQPTVFLGPNAWGFIKMLLVRLLKTMMEQIVDPTLNARNMGYQAHRVPHRYIVQACTRV